MSKAHFCGVGYATFPKVLASKQSGTSARLRRNAAAERRTAELTKVQRNSVNVIVRGDMIGRPESELIQLSQSRRPLRCGAGMSSPSSYVRFRAVVNRSRTARIRRRAATNSETSGSGRKRTGRFGACKPTSGYRYCSDGRGVRSNRLKLADPKHRGWLMSFSFAESTTAVTRLAKAAPSTTMDIKTRSFIRR